MDSDIRKSAAELDALLAPDRNYDVVKRRVTAGGRSCLIYFIDGLVNEDAVQHITDALTGCAALPSGADGLFAFCSGCVPCTEAKVCADYEAAADAVLSGAAAVLCDGISGCVAADCRKYPQRNMAEPENDKVLRGSRVGFTETLTVNTALIRRYIRDPRLVMSAHRVGRVSKTDVVICYLDGEADMRYVKKLSAAIDAIDTDALVMGSQSLAECLIKKNWFDPFPKIRFTERPDCCAAHIIEGKAAVITDNSPAVMILPSAIFDFIQETDDYYLPPLVGTYFRTVRSLVFFLTLFLSPLWYLLISYPQWIPPWLDFIKVQEQAVMPIIMQLFVLEFAVDGLKLAALNTPSMLSGSFSIIGGLILGDLAVKVGWFVPDTIFYMAFVAIANFSQPSYELGYAFKFLRLILLALTGLFGVWGFAAGAALFLVLIAANKTVCGGSYLYPLIPFDGRALSRLLLRRRKTP